MVEHRARVAILAPLMVSVALAPTREAAAELPVKTCTALAEDGQRLRGAGKLIDAREKLMACSVADCPQVVRVDCAQWASEVLASTPTIVIDAKDESGNDVASANVFIDGKLVSDRIDGRPIPVDPGTHGIRVERSDGTSGSQSIVAKENAKAREVKIVLGGLRVLDNEPKREAPSGGRWGATHFVGIGLVALGLAGITYSVVKFFSYRSDESNLREKFEAAEAAARGCPSNASTSEPATTCGKNVATREQLRSEYDANEADAEADKPLVMTGLVAGTALVLGGATLFVLAPSTKAPVRGAPVVTPHFAGMTLGGTF